MPFLTRLCFLFAVDVYKSAETHSFFLLFFFFGTGHRRTSPFCGTAEKLESGKAAGLDLQEQLAAAQEYLWREGEAADGDDC